MTGRQTVVIIGIGNPMRRDDGLGAAAVTCLRQRGLADVRPHPQLVTLDGEPTRLLEAWRNQHTAIVIDAMLTGDGAGSIHRMEVGTDSLPASAGASSSHHAGLAEAIALGRALDVLPERLIVFGIEPADVSFGDGLSDEVNAALPALVERVAAEAAL